MGCLVELFTGAGGAVGLGAGGGTGLLLLRGATDGLGAVCGNNYDKHGNSTIHRLDEVCCTLYSIGQRCFIE